MTDVWQMREYELLGEVLAAADELGILVFHSFDSRTDVGKGMPDIVAAGQNGAFFRELKMERESMSPDQVKWYYRLRAAGIDCELWRPSDLTSGRVREELERIA